jgi:hypothetical protein
MREHHAGRALWFLFWLAATLAAPAEGVRLLLMHA